MDGASGMTNKAKLDVLHSLELKALWMEEHYKEKRQAKGEGRKQQLAYLMGSITRTQNDLF